MSLSNSITIEHFPNIRAIYSSLVVDINEAFRSRLPAEAVLTREVAIDIFKSIKTRSYLAAFFLKPWVVTSLSIGASILVATITVVALVSFAGAIGPASTGVIFSCFVRFTLTLIGAALVAGCRLSVVMWGELERLAEAYSQQGERAQSYLDLLADAESDVRIVIDTPMSDID